MYTREKSICEAKTSKFMLEKWLQRKLIIQIGAKYYLLGDWLINRLTFWALHLSFVLQILKKPHCLLLDKRNSNFATGVITHLHVCLRAGWGCGRCLSFCRNKPPWPPHSHWPSETESRGSRVNWKRWRHLPAQTSNFPRDSWLLLCARQALLLWQADQGSNSAFDHMIDWLSCCVIRPTGLKTQLLLNAVTDGEWMDVGVRGFQKKKKKKLFPTFAAFQKWGCR